MITQSLLSKQLSSRVYEVGAVRDGPVPVRSSQFAVRSSQTVKTKRIAARDKSAKTTGNFSSLAHFTGIPRRKK